LIRINQTGTDCNGEWGTYKLLTKVIMRPGKREWEVLALPSASSFWIRFEVSEPAVWLLVELGEEGCADRITSAYCLHTVIKGSRINSLTMTKSGAYGDVLCGTNREVTMAFAARSISAVRSTIDSARDCEGEESRIVELGKSALL